MGSPEYTFPFARYPGARIALLLILGIALSSRKGSLTFFDNALGAAFILLVIALISLGASLYERYTYRRWITEVVNGCHLLLIVLFGMVLWTVRGNPPDPVRTLFTGLRGADITITGVVSRADPPRNGSQTLYVKVDSVRTQGHSSFLALRANIQVRNRDVGNVSRLPTDASVENPMSFGDKMSIPIDVWSKTDGSLLAHGDSLLTETDNGFVSGGVLLSAGVRVVLDVRVNEWPRRRNPHAFDVSRWLRSMGVQCVAELVGIREVAPMENRLNWIWWRARIDRQIDLLVRESTAPMIKAILLGNKSGLDSEIRTEFSRAGLSHLMAVSGMHVGFVLLPIWFVIPLFWSGRLGRPAGLLLVMTVLVFYAGVTGFSTSVSRASITAFLLALGKLFQQNRDTINTTGVAAIAILLVSPSSLYDIGFQMSFCAVLVILSIGPVLRDLTPTTQRYRWTGFIIQFLGISMVVQWGLFPILADNFGEFSVAGPVANTLGVPLTQFLFLWSMAVVPLSMVTGYASEMLMMPATWSAEALLWIARYVGSSDWSWIRITDVDPMLYLVWLSGCTVMASLTLAPMRWKALNVFLLLMVAMRVVSLVEAAGDRYMKITVFDVGQGDAVLVETPSGKTMLYDTGVWSPTYNSGSSVLVPELYQRGIRHIDALVLSHPHADHIGGALAIIENFTIGTIYQSPMEYSSGVYRNYMKAAADKGIHVKSVFAGELIHLDPVLLVKVLHPGREHYGRDPNAHSVSLKIRYGEKSFLLTGDAEMIAETAMVSVYGKMLRADWYKAGHHGSKTSSNDMFMQYVLPEKVAVSLGLRNRYRHPHREATERLLRYAKVVNFTSLEGALMYRTNGHSLERVHWNQ